MRVAVLGAGNGGLAAAADLTLRGHEVRLFEHPAFREHLVPIRERGGIELIGVASGFASVDLVTDDIRSAVGPDFDSSWAYESFGGV
jgi:opine dehydrogenase